MKYKVKFRINQEGAKGQKFSINLEEASSFLLGPTTVGMKLKGGDENLSPCMLSIRNGQLVAIDRGTPDGLWLNNRKGEEFVIRPGDLLQVSEYTLEFLEAPVVEKENEFVTRFLDVSEGIPDEVGSPKPEMGKAPEALTEPSISSVRELAPIPEDLSASKELPSAGAFGIPDPAFPPPPPVALESSAALHAELSSVIAQPLETFAPPPLESVSQPLEAAIQPEVVEELQTQVPVTVSAVQPLEAVQEIPAPITQTSEDQPPLTRTGSGKSRFPLADFFLSYLILAISFHVASKPFPFEFGPGPEALAFPILAGMALATFLALMAHWTRKFLEVEHGFRVFLRFFAFCSLALMPWSYAYSLGTNVFIGIGAFLCFGVHTAYFLKFRPQVRRFVSLVGGLVLVVGGGAGYFLMQNMRSGEETEMVAARPAKPAPSAPSVPPSAPQMAVQAPPQQPQSPQLQARQAQSQEMQPKQPQPQQPPQQLSQAAPPVPAEAMPLLVVRSPIQGGVPVPGTRKQVVDPMAKAKLFQGMNTNNLSLVKEAIERNGADPNTSFQNGTTGLMMASALGNFNMVHFLTQSGASVNARDSAGTTALMWATLNGHRKVVDYLLKKGADRNIRRQDGDRALEIAKKLRRKDILALLTSTRSNSSREKYKATVSRSSSRKSAKSKKSAKHSSKRTPAGMTSKKTPSKKKTTTKGRRDLPREIKNWPARED